jgi:thiol-disulfide isomerase/thioredoxin
MTYPFTRNYKLHSNVFKPSIYPANTKLNEYIEPKCLYSIIQNSEDVKYTANHPQSKLYGSIQEQLLKYVPLYDEKDKCFKVSINLPSHGWGRQNPTNQLGLAVFHRPHRHSLAIDIYDDYDMVNAQPEIYNQILKQNGSVFGCLSYYCENRDQLLNEIMTHYNNKINTEIIKKIIIALMNGANIVYQFQKYEIETCENHHPFLIQFSQEIPQVIDLIYSHNSHIADDVATANPDKFKTTGDELLSDRKKTVAGLFYQTVERYIQEKCITFLVMNKGFNLLEDAVPSQDGFMIKKKLTYPEIIDDLEYVITNAMGFPIKIKNKPFKEAFKFNLLTNAEVNTLKKKYKKEEELKKQKEIQNEINEIEMVEKQRRFTEWELTHGKIINKAVYYCEIGDTVLLKTPKQLADSFSHLKGFGVLSFVFVWINDNPSIKAKDDLGVYPNELLCPSNIYNLWKPFPFKNKKTPYTKNPEALLFFRNHILILCNNDIVIASHFEKWIGHMLQYPELKSICPVIISQQGSGKGSLMKLLTALIGHSKFFETSNPARDIWGAFNTPLANSFLVNLDELNKKDTIDSMGKIKSLITEPTITINTNGVVQYDIQSYHRFIITTNIRDPIPSEKGDRRMWIISASDELKGNTQYFNKFNELLTNEDVLRTVFDYFNEIPDLKTFGSAKFPMTEYQQNIQECNKTPVELWLEHYVSEHYNETEIELLGSEVFRNFDNYRQSCKFKFEITLTKLIMSLYNFKLDGIRKGRKTNRGNTIIFDIQLLKKHFNLNNLIDIDDFDEDEGGTENDDISNNSN